MGKRKFLLRFHILEGIIIDGKRRLTEVYNMATLEQVLTLARKELGYQESPKNSNRTKYGKWYKLDGNPWCMMFIMWIFHQADASELLPIRTASCSEFMTAAKKVKNWRKNADLQPGDIVIFDFPGNASKAEHVGIVEELCDDSDYVMTIEGNTSTGNDSNGGMVMRRKRKRSLIAGAYRPAYDAEPDASDAAPKADASAFPTLDDPDTEAMLYGGAGYAKPQTASERGEAETASGIVPQVGDLVMFTGHAQFSGPYDDAEAVPATTCMARIDDYCPGSAHPFRLGGKGIEGWADYGDAEIVDEGDGGIAISGLIL